jgi:hypothetical protein
MRASLDKNLLIKMLSRGGWLSSAEDDCHVKRAAASHPPVTVASGHEWFLSQRLSRQCALASGWTGNGLDIGSVFEESSEIDFADLTNGYAGGLLFTTSVCNRFLCVARDTLIYIYDLDSGLPKLTTSVICPRRVLGMSMDVSSGRFAVAALLEGRMGMVSELKQEEDNLVEVHVEDNGPHTRTSNKTSVQTSQNEYAGDIDFRGSEGRQLHPHNDCLRAKDQTLSAFDAIHVRSNDQDISIQGTDDEHNHDQHLINQTWNLDLNGPSQRTATRKSCMAESCARNVPAESGGYTFYRHLCSEDDPPRSVSICPQRRCIAFGCSAGIELHWIDALTGQSLSRWFPLTAPSDWLYFLPPRPGFESAKKLRLISSAAHPEDWPAISRQFFLGRSTTNSFWGSLGFESAFRHPGSPSCDHYNAIPLSDGHHILFVDPVGGKLTFGCDAPLGGPMKLLRKVVFLPPEGETRPKLYSASADLSHGVSVVVTYGDKIVFYRVPSDICRQSQIEQTADSWGPHGVSPFSVDASKKNHWLN